MLRFALHGQGKNSHVSTCWQACLRRFSAGSAKQCGPGYRPTDLNVQP